MSQTKIITIEYGHTYETPIITQMYWPNLNLVGFFNHAPSFWNEGCTVAYIVAVWKVKQLH